MVQFHLPLPNERHTMKIIFLDIDGVLNTARTLPLKEKYVEIEGTIIGFNQLDKDCINQLNRVTDKTGAKIVISSSWRIGCRTPAKFEILKKHLRDEGVTGEIIGRTPTDQEYAANLGQPGSYGTGPGQIYFGYCRGKEIQMWLDQNAQFDKFVIVDDNSDMDHLNHRLVQTQFEVGITSADADDMIWMLTTS